MLDPRAREQEKGCDDSHKNPRGGNNGQACPQGGRDKSLDGGLTARSTGAIFRCPVAATIVETLRMERRASNSKLASQVSHD